MKTISQEILDQLKKDTVLFKLNKDINKLRETPFVEMEQNNRDALGDCFQDIENRLEEKYKINLSDIEMHPEEFLYEIFG